MTFKHNDTQPPLEKPVLVGVSQQQHQAPQAGKGPSLRPGRAWARGPALVQDLREGVGERRGGRLQPGSLASPARPCQLRPSAEGP